MRTPGRRRAGLEVGVTRIAYELDASADRRRNARGRATLALRDQVGAIPRDAHAGDTPVFGDASHRGVASIEAIVGAVPSGSPSPRPRSRATLRARREGRVRPGQTGRGSVKGSGDHRDLPRVVTERRVGRACVGRLLGRGLLIEPAIGLSDREWHATAMLNSSAIAPIDQPLRHADESRAGRRAGTRSLPRDDSHPGARELAAHRDLATSGPLEDVRVDLYPARGKLADDARHDALRRRTGPVTLRTLTGREREDVAHDDPLLVSFPPRGTRRGRSTRGRPSARAPSSHGDGERLPDALARRLDVETRPDADQLVHQPRQHLTQRLEPGQPR